MLKLLAFRTFEVREFLVFIMPDAKNLALISNLCQIYALYNKCDILNFKRNHFTFFLLEKKMWLMCVAYCHLAIFSNFMGTTSAQQSFATTQPHFFLS